MKSMKHKRKEGLLSLLALWVVSFLLISGCASAPKTADAPSTAPEEFLSRTEERVLPLYPEAGDESPRMTVGIRVLEAMGPQSQEIHALLYDGLDPTVYTQRRIDLYAQQYLAMQSSEVMDPQEQEEQLLESLNWEFSETWEARFLEPEVWVISRNLEYYQGGAHGMTEKRYTVLSLDAQGVQALTLGDLLEADALPGVQALITQALRSQAGLEPDVPLTEGGFLTDDPEVPANCFLAPAGLGFHWDPYEIGPYVMGPVEVLIPYERLQGLLRPRWIP
ncbi:MAG: DUF3298 and DUF4163 domain-containing protein [Spirochaetaceae bacterium]|jgi:hypothetical protein|nr:DUF3298 and DUF4163 domain-containing protein [Spirochaetaceae bacterium]